MTELFRRTARLQIGETLIEHGRDARGVDFDFNITRTITKHPNTADINVYNLSPDNRSALQEPIQDGDQQNIPVILHAGYVDSRPTLIFSGDLREARSKREGTNIVTNISSGDGGKSPQTPPCLEGVPRASTSP